ncbi:hypothetical protein F5Y00DRAFT_27191 [Daldinia vernicosa]|uniref:uncharacterized protein n=1 Tax=Daldinia vernicosa TaxID=114800 RepID=UPI002008A535|nr:uncharacterized protein F5Y00DRAFT_27191 [Daldinia vernicosa]KAI0850702.1 hypothetical protein F5Y00DRAFT_27191 [Daldinia vernicosa]
MPAASMTSAARLISNPNFKSGWGAVLTPQTNEVIRSVKKEADGMYRLQTARDRPVSPTSIYTALFWEARNFRKPTIVYTPAVDDELQLFSEEGKGFDKARKEIRKKTSDNVDGSNFHFHPIFNYMRDCRFTLWPIHLPVQDVWVTVIMQIGDISTNVQELYTRFDREVVTCAIVDPFPNERDDRQYFVKERLAEILEEGRIYLPDSAMIESFTTEDVREAWETGHVAYAVCREFIRRLRVLNYQQDCGRVVNTDLLWTEFEEHHDIDSYRESMMAACAHRTIRNSGYHVRMALEVPSEKSNYNPDDLNPFFEDLPDEWFTTSKKKSTSKSQAKTSKKDESITVRASTPASEHESDMSQLHDSESDGHGSEDAEVEADADIEANAEANAEIDAEVDVEAEAEAGPVVENDVYTPTNPAFDGHDTPAESPVLESIEVEEPEEPEEPHAHEVVVTDIDQGLEEQGNTSLGLVTPEPSREATPTPVTAMQPTVEDEEEPSRLPTLKRKLDDDDDDAEQPPTKRTKIEDFE